MKLDAVDTTPMGRSQGAGRSFARRLAAAAGAVVVGAAALVSGAGSAPTAEATPPICAPVSIYVTSGGSGNSKLLELSPSGQVLRSIPLTADNNPATPDPITYDYGDIAFSGDGTKLYGIVFDGDPYPTPPATIPPPTLNTINIQTGGVTDSRTITGDMVGQVAFNGLSGLPNGHLLVGTSLSQTLYDLNPTTGVSIAYTSTAMTLPATTSSGGDFLTLGDGDILALTYNGGYSNLVRLHPGGTTAPTTLGRVPLSYGMAQVAGDLYLAKPGASGAILKVTGIPTMGNASTFDLAAPSVTLTDRSTGLAFSTAGLSFWGATSTQDSGECNALAASVSRPVYSFGSAPSLIAGGLANSATGTVTFTTGSTPLCTVTLPSTTCTGAPVLVPGTYPVDALYSANGQTAATTFEVLPPPIDERRVQSVSWASGPKSGAAVPLDSLTVGVAASATSGLSPRYAASPATVCTVSSAGIVTLVGAGTCTVTASQDGGTAWKPASATLSFTVTAPIDVASRLPLGPSRLAGPDRVSTSVAVSKAAFPDGKSDAVVIASSTSFADSISGARLASLEHGPLLLTDPTKLDASVAAEVRRLMAPGGTVYVLGQSKAMSNGVQSALDSLSGDFDVDRRGGDDRYSTAVSVAEGVTETTGDTGSIYLVTGRDYADGVATSALAARTGGVVLLTDGTKMPAATAAYLAAHDRDGSRTVPVGGAARTAASSAGLSSAAGRAVVGSDRYQTAALLASKFQESAAAGTGSGTGSSTSAATRSSAVATVGLANGQSWPDALTGSAVMGAARGPLLLAEPKKLPSATAAALEQLQPQLTRGVVFGGPASIDDSTYRSVATYVSAPQ